MLLPFLYLLFESILEGDVRSLDLVWFGLMDFNGMSTGLGFCIPSGSGISYNLDLGANPLVLY